MKRALFLLSLLANGVLAFVYVQRLQSRSAKEDRRQKGLASASVVHPRFIPLDAEAWGKLQAETNPDLVARLRAEGFPAEMIVEIIDFRLTEQFAQRRAAILALKKPIEFWKYRKRFANGPQAGLEAQARAQLRALDDEQAKQKRDLLGSDLLSPARYRKREYGDLPDDTIRQIQEINNDYRELTIQARDDMQGILLPADRERLKFLEKERRTDLAALMTPEQLEDYKLRASPTASQLQDRLSAFTPSESEYKQIFSLQSAFDDQYGTNELTPEEEKRRNDAQPQLLEQLKAALGPDRFEEYKITTDPSYQRTEYFANGSGLPQGTTNRLIAIQQAITQKAAAVKSDSMLSPEQRDAQLRDLSLQATTQLTTVLDAEALARYKNGVGYWLTHVQPAPTKGSSL